VFFKGSSDRLQRRCAKLAKLVDRDGDGILDWYGEDREVEAAMADLLLFVQDISENMPYPSPSPPVCRRARHQAYQGLA